MPLTKKEIREGKEEEIAAKIKELLPTHSYKEIAEELGYANGSTVNYWINKLGISSNTPKKL